MSIKVDVWKRFEIIGPFHGEGRSIWQIYDNSTEEMIGTIDQKGNITQGDPCSGRSCDECEIGGCDHGI
jgi:hypothetical protein